MTKENGTLLIHRCDRGYVLSILGRGTMNESATVRDFISGAIEDGAAIMVDLSECTYLDSTFLGCLVMLHQRGEASGGSFHIVADEPVRKKLLGSVRLDQLLHFAEAPPKCAGEAVELPVVKLDRQEFGRHVLETHEKLSELGGPLAGTFKRIAEQLQQEVGGDR